MAGNNSKGSSDKRPPSSSSERKSRSESKTPAAVNRSSDTIKSSKAAGSGRDLKPPNRPPSNPGSDKSTPKRGPNPSPGQPKPLSDSTPRSSHGPVPPPEAPFPFPEPPSLGPPPPPPAPTFGFHMLDRRTIVLADGSVRSYFTLPPDYQDFTPPQRPPLDPMSRFMPRGPELIRFTPLGPMSPDGFRDRGQDYWNSLGFEGCGGPEGSMKRKFGEREDVVARQRQQLLHYANAGANLGTGSSSPLRRNDDYRSSKHMRIGDGGFDNNVGLKQEIDPAVSKAFLHFVKMINENANQRQSYLENGKHGPVQCLACGRSSKDFPDVHALLMHIYNSDNAVDHLGFHKALCVLMGWNCLMPPDNSRAYQFLPADEAAANQDDLIMWPPMVIIHNTNTGEGKDGRMEGLGNKTMDSKLRDLGFPGGKSKSLYGRDGHLGINIIKFGSDQSGLKEAMRLADHFEKEHYGRRDWACVESAATGRDDEKNPDLVTVDPRTGERKRVLYGYLATASDLHTVDLETRKKVVIESKCEKLQSSKYV